MARQRFRTTFWVIVPPVAIVLLLGAAALTAYLVHYSATSTRVCGQCHSELVELWEESRGHPADQTSCYQCHSKGPMAIPENWNLIRHVRDQVAPPVYLADDSLTSQRCLDCHEGVLEFGYTPQKRVIQFSHRFHIEEGMACVDCHRAAGHQYWVGGTNRPTAMECLNCHLKDFLGPPESQKCLGCHDVMLVPGRKIKRRP